MNNTTSQLLVPNDGAYLGIIGSYVAAVARQVGLPEEEVAKVRLAVGEACKNVIQHAYPPGVSAHYRVTCETTAEQLCIKIWDGGAPFDLARIPPPNLTADVTKRRVGGLGLYLMRQWVDEVQVFPCPEGKELWLLKRAPRKGKESEP